MSRTRLNVTLGLALLSLLLTPMYTPAADTAAVIPLFTSQKTVTTGTAIGGRSTYGFGIYGFTEDGIGVFGQDAGTTQGRGYGGIFLSNTGIGVYGRSMATPIYSNNLTPGVYGSSKYGYGVYGTSDDSGKGGVYGYATGTWAHGVSGYTTGTEAYGGYFSSDNYRGLFAYSGSGDYAAYFQSYLNSTYPGLYVRGYSTFNGYIYGTGKSGFVVEIAFNDGTESLETGDLVVITGSGEPVIGEIPLIRVSKCTTAASSAVVGVVDRQHIIPPPEPNADMENDAVDTGVTPRPAATPASLADGTGIAPGAYLSVVTLGSFKAVKADATAGPIVPGSLLVASPEPGHVMAADSPACGTVVGKSLGGLDSGTGLIPVMVTLQ